MLSKDHSNRLPDHLDDYPHQVTIVRQRHPFEGMALEVLGWCHRRGELQLDAGAP